MRVFRILCATLFAAALLLPAAGIEGRWKGELAAKGKGNKAKPGKRATGAAQTPGPTPLSFDFQSAGGQLTGAVTASKGRRARPVTLTDGKVDGDRFSFTTSQKTRKGERKLRWEGVLQGDKLTGTCTPEGARRGTSFTASRGQ